MADVLRKRQVFGRFQPRLDGRLGLSGLLRSSSPWRRWHHSISCRRPVAGLFRVKRVGHRVRSCQTSDLCDSIVPLLLNLDFTRFYHLRIFAKYDIRWTSREKVSQIGPVCSICQARTSCLVTCWSLTLTRHHVVYTLSVDFQCAFFEIL